VTASANPLLVEAWRGGIVESAHRGALVVVDADGHTVLALGDADRAVFPRSAVKALQALPLVAGGAADALALTDAELAIACASHNGEPRHAATSAAMLAKAGVDVTALECGTHWPTLDTAVRALVQAGAEPSALHNNCSGKHAGFVCLGCLLAEGRDLRSFLRGYVEPGHALMREVGAALSAATGVDVERAPRGIDGCSIPAHALPLRALALGFARFGTGIGLSAAHARAAQRLRAAVAAEPFMVAGTGRFDTRVMERLGTRVFCKVGAEAVYCAALPDRGWGLALKIDDGATARAAEVAMAAAIEAIVPLADDDAGFVRGLADLTLRNWRGTGVGRLRATDTLRAALRSVAR
jgi:L-asparaginase II